MKKHAKKALGHKVSVLGKTVPTMLVIGLFLVGGTSAALLNNFATISGDTTAEQSVVLQDGDEGYTTSADFGLTNPVYGGDTEVSSETLENRGEADTDVRFGLTHTESRAITTQGGNTIYADFTHSSDEVEVEITGVSGGSASDYDVQLDQNLDEQADSTESGNPAAVDLSSAGNQYQLRFKANNDQSDWIEQRRGQVYGLDTTVFDVTSPYSMSAKAGNVDVGYDMADDEVTFTTTDISDYGSNEGVVYGFDTDNDGDYDFQVDATASHLQPDYYEYEGGSWTGDTHDYTQNNNEYDGVYFTDSGTELQNKNSFTLTVDADRLGSDFAFNVKEDSGDFVKPPTKASNNALDATPGQPVNGPVTMDGESTRDFVFVNEFDSLLQPGDYGVTVDVLPAGN